MLFDLLVFDLDGTLIDSALDLALAVNAVRAEAGEEPLEHERIYSYVGDGAPMLIRRALGPEASETAVSDGLEYFLRYYNDHMLDNTALYPGVREALDAWAAENRAMAVLTNKPVVFSKRILDGLGVRGLFFEVYGGNSFATKKPDPEGLHRLIEQAGSSQEKTLMVGDSHVDIQTARNAGTAAAGVSYGLQPESFVEHPPDVLVDSMPELVEIVRDGRIEHRVPARP